MRISSLAALILGLLTLLATSSSLAQTRLGAELSAGRADMLIPLIADRTYLDPNAYVVVGDEAQGGGISATLRVLLLTSLEIQVGLQSFARESLTLSLRSKLPIDRRRQRTNGTVDDAGVKYDDVARESIDLDYAYQGNLLLISAMAGYRYYFFDYKGFYGYGHANAGIAISKILGDPYPIAFGMRADVGVGALYKFVNAFGIFLRVSFAGVISQNYFSPEDASRIVYRNKGFTEQAVFDTTIYSNVQAGIHYSFQ